jgi:two-component sensor histidine kinase
MNLGYELVKEQLFFRRELIERVFWFIKLRWVAIGVALVGTWGAHLMGYTLPLVPLNIIFAAIVLYNILFLAIGRWLEPSRHDKLDSFTFFAPAQISLDLLALYLLIYFTGGVGSPFLVFVIFHIILAGMLLPGMSCFIYGICVIVALGGLILSQSSFLPPQPIPFAGPFFYFGPEYPGLLFLTFAVAILVPAFLVTCVVTSLRTKGRELLRVSLELDSSNAKLKALYDMVKEMGVQSELQGLMDAATRLAASTMGVKACAIKLLDEQQTTLRFASTYGLSEDYLSKGSIEIDKSPINQRIIQGSFYEIGDIRDGDYFQYPEDIRKEGIASLLCLPLKVEKMILGVFCVYSDESYHFGENDTAFFSLVADLTAIAIENLKADLTKSWFLRKAAHQLRSPLNAIFSMLKLIRNDYLGPLGDKQKEMLGRCERRIVILNDLINDLLELGKRRAEVTKSTLHPVDLRKALAQLVPLYQTRAVDKGLEIEFQIQDTVPHVMGDEELVDELFTNLISNAIKYTPQGGRVEVRLSTEDRGWAQLEVSDTGIGIAEEDVPRLFSEFFRAENAKAFEEQGTGLGLVIVKEILDRLRGTVQLKSKIGKGTCLTCMLPAIAQS